MKLSNAVDRVAADDREIRHANHRLAAFLDQRHAADAIIVTGPVLADLDDEARVDLVNNVEEPRQQAPEHRYRPHLESFRQQRVIGVGHRAVRDLPGLVPLEVVFIHQQAHQFGDGNGRVRIVQLEAVLLREQGEVVTVIQHPVTYQILQAG